MELSSGSTLLPQSLHAEADGNRTRLPALAGRPVLKDKAVEGYRPVGKTGASRLGGDSAGTVTAGGETLAEECPRVGHSLLVPVHHGARIDQGSLPRFRDDATLTIVETGEPFLRRWAGLERRPRGSLLVFRLGDGADPGDRIGPFRWCQERVMEGHGRGRFRRSTMVDLGSFNPCAGGSNPSRPTYGNVFMAGTLQVGGVTAPDATRRLAAFSDVESASRNRGRVTVASSLKDDHGRPAPRS